MSKQQMYKLLAFLGGWGFLAFFLWQVDFQLVAENLQIVGWQFVWVLLITGLAYAMAAAAWLLCFRHLPKQLTASKLFVFRQIGETLTTINPANIIIGESAKLYLLKKEGIAYQDGLVSILLSRILIMLSMVALFFLLPFLFFNCSFLAFTTWQTMVLLGGLTALIVGLFYSLVHEKLYLHKCFCYLKNRLPFKFLDSLLPKVKELNELLSQFYQQQKRRLLFAFLLSLLHWLMGAAEIYFILFLLNVKCSFFNAVLIEVGVTCIKSMGAFIPGQIGIEEYGNKLMLELLQMGSGGLWLTLSILRRTRQLFWLIIGGLFFLVVYKGSSKPAKAQAFFPNH